MAPGTFEIHTLLLGTIKVPHADGVLEEPIHAWYATDGETRILFDSGMPSVAENKRRLAVESTGGGSEALTAALAACGTAPEQIDLLVLSHLHFDHAWNLELFPEACVIVQRDEMIHAMDPSATQRIYYLREILPALLARKRPARLRLIDGDHDLVPGFRLLKVPGHTPGMQAAIVSTARGKVGLVSDLGDSYRCWYPADPRASDQPMRFMAGSFLPGAIRTESERCYQDSMARVLAEADIIVPAHDPRIPRHMPSDWFELPEPATPAHP